jgi:hypothetical protein
MPIQLQSTPDRMGRDSVFDRIRVDFMVNGPVRVSWSLSRLLTDPDPWTFRLQRSSVGAPDADDWADVGTPQLNASAAVDPAKTLHGTLPTTHYRVVLETPAGRYASSPMGVFADLDHKDWLYAREIVRKERLRAVKCVSVRGYLFKRRWKGPAQPTQQAADPREMVLDPLTGDIIKRQAASSTMGTPFLGGYFRPLPFEVDCYPTSSDPDVDPQRGNVDDPGVSQAGRVIMFPPVTRGDVFVDASSDARYELKPVKYTAAIRGVPIVADVDMRMFPFDDVIYSLPLS